MNEKTPTLVTAQMSISLDGYYAGARFFGDSKDINGWMKSHEAKGFFRVTRWVIDAMAWRERQGFKGGEATVDSDIMAETFEAAGAYVMGRRMFDGGEIPWGDTPPFRAPVFVVTHRPREPLPKEGGTSFTFVSGGLEEAIGQARIHAAAANKNVAISGGGSLLRQALKAGLVDQLELHVAPVVLGKGMALFDSAGFDLGDHGLELEAERVISSPGVLHLRYKVKGPVPLVLDDRGRSG